MKILDESDKWDLHNLALNPCFEMRSRLELSLPVLSRIFRFHRA